MVALEGEQLPDEVTEAVPVGTPSVGAMTSATPVAWLVARFVTRPVTVISPPLSTDWDAHTVVHVAESESMSDGVP